MGEDHIGLTSSSQEIRCLDVDDISEIRPGKISLDMDGTDLKPRITIIGSETRICLPLPSKKLRDKLLRRFQTFLKVRFSY